MWRQMHYFDFGMKAVHEWRVARSTVKQQKNVEWEILLQAVFLYLWAKVVEKPVLENGLCNTGFGVTLPHTRKREPLAMFLRALGFSE